MKTPMQEHIEWLKKEKDEHGYEKHPYFECAIEHAESMLEKEKEMIMRTYQDGLDNGFINGNWNLISYYNETFNTKEKSEQFYCSSYKDGEWRCKTQCLECTGVEEQFKQ